MLVFLIICVNEYRLYIKIVVIREKEKYNFSALDFDQSRRSSAWFSGKAKSDLFSALILKNNSDKKKKVYLFTRSVSNIK